jgi:hypothetical protein
MYNLNIQIKEVDYKTKLIYEPGILDETLKKQIKQHKKGILQRMEENEVARNAGFLIYNHGLIYEYRYGLGAYLYIERLPEGLTSVWRENYLPDQQKPHRIKIIADNVPFKKAFKEAQGFINWLNNKRGRKGA